MTMMECDKCGQPYGFGCICGQKRCEPDQQQQEIAKLREELKRAEDCLCYERTRIPELIDRAEAAEELVRKARAQEPIGEVEYDRKYANCTGKMYKELEEGSKLYASPPVPADVQELQAKYDDVCLKWHDAVDARAELERKLAEQQIRATRYERLRILGCAPYGSSQLDGGLVLRFQNLDTFVDSDIALVKSRGDFRGGEREELTTLLAKSRAEGYEAGKRDAVPESLLNALRNWTGAEPSQSVLAREVDNWLEAAPKQEN